MLIALTPGLASATDECRIVDVLGSGRSDMATDASGNVYILGEGEERVEVYASDGEFVREWEVRPTSRGIAIDETETVYVVSFGAVVAYSLLGKQLFSFPICVGQSGCIGTGIDVRNGIAYICTLGPLRRYLTDGTQIETWGGLRWNDVHANADGSVWAVSNFPDIVRLYSSEGETVTEWSTVLPGEPYASPSGITLDSLGRVFVADVDRGEGSAIKIFAPDGTIEMSFRTPGRAFRSLELDGDQTLYAGDIFFSEVVKFQCEPVPVNPTTWGVVKSRFRAPR